MENNARRGGVVGPLVLISAGVILLLNNLGLVDWSIWRIAWRLWPALLIVVGLDLLIGRRTLAGGLLALALSAAVLAGGMWLLWRQEAVVPPVVERISQPLGDAARAEVRLNPAVGDLQVSALSGSGNLLSGHVAVRFARGLEQKIERRGDEIRLALGLSGEWTLSPLGFGHSTRDLEWNLALTKAVPIDLAIQLGVGRGRLDLRSLNLEALEVDVGVGELQVTLPEQGHYVARLHGGVGQTRVVIPAGLAVRLVVDSGLTSVEVQGMEKHGEAYYTPGAQSIAERVELRVEQGVGSILIRTE